MISHETVSVSTPQTTVAALVPRFGFADGVMIVTMISWGFNFIVLKFSVSQLSPLAFTTIRHIGASIILLSLLAAQRPRVRFTRREWALLIVLGLLGVTFHQPLAMYGVANTTAGNAGLILSSTPVFLSVFNHALGRERLSLRAWLGVIASFIGMAMVIGGDGVGFSLSTQHFLGDMLALAAIVLWALYTLLAQPLLERHDSLSISALSMAVGTVPLTLLALPATIAQAWQAVSVGAWLGILYSMIFGIALGFLIWNWGVKKLGSTRASLYSNLTPVIALLAGVAILSENLTFWRLAGAVIIVGGIYLSRSSAILRRDDVLDA